MTKTLGEIAKEARNALDYARTHEDERWEIVAAAVAAEVRKQCIAACEERRIAGTSLYRAHNAAIEMCVATIKGLK